ncbi:MAG: YegS/Rv2252/BmrU family lipid kinase [Anaerotignum sp.]|nr:YegS/Rv2252/BmrU family lipid kinase [Anaerotignum sp.]MBQ3616287.1 YegS/Rv2252/BmrU family lipid kinase [Anaerotignum sp.]MBQ7084823.1 YegS/Rv2252/BmrU family lipid kinase [Anaerotignum sp.]
MKKLKLIYNPFSGNKSFKFDLDVCIGIFQEGGYEVHPFRTLKPGDIDQHIAEMDPNYDIIVASGGDGTVNIVINAMLKRGLKTPLGIIPSGTANDFATYLGFKSGNVEDVCRTIVSTKPVKIDLGLVNEEIYFINVVAGGYFTNVSQTVDKDLKNALGSLSYYLKGVEQLPQFRKIPYRITTSSEVIEEDLYLYMILNSAGTGGFTNLSPEGTVTDGEFEFLAVKGKPLYEMTPTVVKMLTGEHIHDKNILYLKDSYFKVECLDPTFKIMETTVDGEMGPDMPFEMRVVPKVIPVFGKFDQIGEKTENPLIALWKNAGLPTKL